MLEKRPDRWPGQINLFHINPSEFESLLLPQWPELPLIDRLNAIVPFWELPMLPPDWLPCLRAMDAVLAPTEYIRNVIQQEVPDKPVLHFPQNIPVCAPAEPDRARFALPENAFVFLCAFDIMSDLERKNPWGSIAAFQKAFPENPDVRLVLKVSNAHNPDNLVPLKQAMMNDPRILIIAEMLPPETLRTLYASCDTLVSLHRAEGLGLILMEMMMQGKPVIATAWSGNMDFTTPQNACLVNFSMIPVKAEHPAYRFSAETHNLHWAEADTDTAADWMKKLVSDPGFCNRIGRAARKSMLERAEMDCTPVLKQLQAQYNHGLSRPMDTLQYIQNTLKQAKKRRRRRQIRRIEKAIKKIFRPEIRH